jgi:type III pantothenate kinase
VLFAVDVSNTHTAFGVFRGAELVHEFRVESAKGRTADETHVLLVGLLELEGLSPRQISGAVIASVVPGLTEPMVAACMRAFGQAPMVVGPGTRTGMPILYESPREVAPDRIVNALAAYERARSGVIVVDFSTATIFDCISPRGEYLGGVIAPGIRIAAEALFTRAARLSRVPIRRPDRVIGTNTEAAMQSGIVFGYVGLVDGLVERIQAELGFPTRVYATGSMASPVAEACDRIDEVLPHLTLEGLRLVFERSALTPR